MIQTILLPVAADPSPAAAVRRAADLARHTGARVLLLHAVHAEGAPLDFEALQADLAPLLDGVTVQALQRRGPPAREILAAARDEGADLIVMSPHGRWKSASDVGLPRFLIHSVLCRILLEADCPVWVEPEDGAPDIGRLACGVASLFLDRAMIAGAAAMAALLQARLILFRNSVNAAISIPKELERVKLWQREVAMAVQADLEALRAGMNLEADIRVHPGDFATALLEDAVAAEAGLIAVRRTSREWGRDQALQTLVRGTAVPVLVYPDDAPRHAAAPTLPPASPRTARLMAWLAFAAVMALGLWIIHNLFVHVMRPDCTGSAYSCGVRENLVNSTKDRLGQPQPKADPKLGPFKDDPPPKAGADPRQ